MPGIKKSIRPINKARRVFLKFLKDNNAEDIYDFDGFDEKDSDWEYYHHITAFINGDLYDCCFARMYGKDKIDYSDPSVRYSNMEVQEFIDMIK